MHEPPSVYLSQQWPAHHADMTPQLRPLLGRALCLDAVEKAAAFGRWWLDVQSAQMVLSVVAADFLDVEGGWHGTLESGFAQVVPEDVRVLMAALAQAGVVGQQVDCEFRILNAETGLRWLRIASLSPCVSAQAVQTGVLIDVTASRHAAMRERFSFESTQFLVATHTVDDAVNRTIRLVCENLGWEWGAYWSLEQDPAGGHQLVCSHFWHDPAYALQAFTQDSRALRVVPGQGLVGDVWATGRAAWVDGMAHDRNFLRAASALESGLQSGYAFPVSYVMPDGRRHSPGVLEFFSSLARQREAQLPSLAGAIGGLVAQTVQRLEQQETIRLLAQADDLTGLNNRSYLHQLLDATCLSARAVQQSFGVMYIDLDRFKLINDAFGHDAGNAVLREFARRLQKLVAKGCHAGRLGGDEFAVVTTPMAPSTLMARLRTLADDVLLAARTPFHFGNHALTVSASIGISVYPDHGLTTQALLRGSDAAMYRVKRSGRNAMGFLESASTVLEAQQSSLVQQLTMEAELHQALVEEEFFLEYQPVFDSLQERVVAVEALIRWRRADGEVVRPDVFIPIAEQSRLIVQIGRWVVERACRDLARLHRAGFPSLQLNVNMAASEFVSASLPAELAAVAEAHGIATHHLCLELTENMVMTQADKVIPVMRALRQRGFKISLDDFGIEHSSLSRLKNLPISSVKIDRSFVSGLPQDRGDAAIVRTILDLGRNMKLQVIAEGVETDGQLNFLRQFGCGYIQGFVFSRPLPLETLVAVHGPQGPERHSGS